MTTAAGLIVVLCLGGLSAVAYAAIRRPRPATPPAARPVSAQRLARLHIIDDQGDTSMMTNEFKDVSPREIIEVMDGRVTYRMLDYWIRSGWITISEPADGSGSRRRLTIPEARALHDLVDEYERVKAMSARITSGQFFAARLEHHRDAVA